MSLQNLEDGRLITSINRTNDCNINSIFLVVNDGACKTVTMQTIRKELLKNHNDDYDIMSKHDAETKLIDIKNDVDLNKHTLLSVQSTLSQALSSIRQCNENIENNQNSINGLQNTDIEYQNILNELDAKITTETTNIRNSIPNTIDIKISSYDATLKQEIEAMVNNKIAGIEEEEIGIFNDSNAGLVPSTKLSSDQDKNFLNAKGIWGKLRLEIIPDPATQNLYIALYFQDTELTKQKIPVVTNNVNGIITPDMFNKIYSGSGSSGSDGSGEIIIPSIPIADNDTDGLMSAACFALLDFINKDYVPIATFNRLDSVFIRQSDAEKYLTQSDSGWTTASITNTNFDHYANNRKVQFRKIGKLVEIRGAITNISEITYDSITKYDNIFTLPSGFRPSQQITSIQQGSNLNTYMLNIDIDGSVEVGRYCNNDGNNTIPQNSWLNMNLMYFVD